MTVLNAILYGFLITGGTVLVFFVLAWVLLLTETLLRKLFPNVDGEILYGGFMFLSASLLTSFVVYIRSFPPYN